MALAPEWDTNNADYDDDVWFGPEGGFYDEDDEEFWDEDEEDEF